MGTVNVIESMRAHNVKKIIYIASSSIVEYKKFFLHKSNTRLTGIEFPSNNGNFYPMTLTLEQNLAQKYFDKFPEQNFSIDRNSSCRFSVDINNSIE